ncbi:hypothetical protein [Azospirillum argentinense]
MLWTLINEAPAQVRKADQGLRRWDGDLGVWRVGGRTCSFSVSADWELVLAGPTHVSILSSMTYRRVAAGNSPRIQWIFAAQRNGVVNRKPITGSAGVGSVTEMRCGNGSPNSQHSFFCAGLAGVSAYFSGRGWYPGKTARLQCFSMRADLVMFLSLHST